MPTQYFIEFTPAYIFLISCLIATTSLLLPVTLYKLCTRLSMPKIFKHRRQKSYNRLDTIKVIFDTDSDSDSDTDVTESPKVDHFVVETNDNNLSQSLVPCLRPVISPPISPSPLCLSSNRTFTYECEIRQGKIILTIEPEYITVTSPYKQRFKQILKTELQANWIVKQRTWCMDRCHYSGLIQAIKKCYPDACLPDLFDCVD